MGKTIMNALFNNAALLLILSVIFEVSYFLPSKFKRMKQIISGLLIALICIAIMSIPFTLQTGVVFDTRSILISVTALFFGIIPTIITVAVAVITRLFMGGAGTLPGIAVIITSALIGLAWRRWVYQESTKRRLLSIYAMGVSVHVTMLACMLLIPSPDNLIIIRAIGLPVMLLYPIVSVALSLLLIRQRLLRDTQDQIKESEEKYRKIAENISDVVWTTDLDLKTTYISPSIEHLVGESIESHLNRTLDEKFPPDSMMKIRNILAEEMEKEKDPQCNSDRARVIELEHYRADGTIIWIAMNISIIRDDNGRPIGFQGVSRDITKRVYMEKLLQQNLKDLSETQRIAHIGTWRFDLSTNQVVWTEELYKMYGFDPTVPPPPYTEHMKLFTPESWNRLSTSLENTRTSGTPYELELETVTRDGSNGWMWVSGEAEKDEDDNIVSLWGAAQDISEYKTIEFELKQSEEKFKLLFEQAPIGYLALDSKGYFVEVNQKWLDIFGYNKKEVIGKWLGDFLCPEYVDAFTKRFEFFKEKGYIQSEVEMLSKDSRRILIAFEGKISYEADGQFKQTHGVMQDITAQRTTEIALKESEERYRQLSEQSRTFTWEVDEQGLYTFVDHVCETVLGFHPEELIRKKHFYDIWPEESRDKLKQTAFDVFEQKGLFNGLENKAYTKNGDIVVLSTTGLPLLKDDGSLLGYRGSDTDITSRKKIEQALIHSHDLMRYIIEHNRSAVAVHDRDLKYLYVSQRYLDEYKIEVKDIIGKHHYEIFPDLPQKWRDVHQKALLGEVFSEDKDPYLSKDGSIEWTRWECRPWYESDGSIGGIIVYTEVITDHVRLLNDLQDKEHNLRLAQEIAHVGSFRYDPKIKKLAFSDESFNICGISKEKFSGETDAIINLIHPDDKEKALEITLEAMSKNKVMRSELRITRPDGEERIVDFRVQKSFDENEKYIRTTGTIQDITERKKAEENLIYLNNHDFLTGLHNRRYFEEEIIRLDVKVNLPLSIIMVDTNGLKIINDSFGHDVGDELLKKSVYAIKQACRVEDLIVRYGGDEFIIVLPNTNTDETLKIASSIKELASKEKIVNIELSISYGYATKYSTTESIMAILANAENHMYSNKLSERSSTKSKIMEIIMNALFEKSHRESQHSMRVSRVCEEISTKMKLEKQEVNKIRIAGLVHDIGKIGIDEKILNKPGKLDGYERNEIEKHAEAGWRILSSSNEFAELAQCVLYHHERWDGNGYPKKLKGEKIPIEARIIAVADSYDAMTSERSYKAAMSHEDAIREILRCSGTQFDPAIVDAFVNKV